MVALLPELRLLEAMSGKHQDLTEAFLGISECYEKKCVPVRRICARARARARARPLCCVRACRRASRCLDVCV